VLAAELGRLSGDQREALRLRVVEERPYEEVAQALGISDGRSPGRLSLYGGELRATAHLRGAGS
jgi:DNA-directed RNA polymerase specialized sigma24 family protein